MILKRIVFLHLLFLIVFFQTVSSSSGGTANLSTPLHTGQAITTASVSLTTIIAFSTGTVSSTISVNATTTTVNSVQPTTTLQVHSSSVSVTGEPKTSTIEVKAIDSTEGTSLKARLLYIFFAAFGGVVLLLAICVAVACWIGKSGVKENDVRPLTISSLELTENQS